MKRYFSLSNVLTVILVVAVLYLQGPTWLANNSVNNKKITNLLVVDIKTNKSIYLDNSKKYLLFFWATWCAPCKAEMQRYKLSIDSGKINKNQFFAINPFESIAIQKKFIKNNSYPFTFVNDGKAFSQLLNIKATPTITFIENGLVKRQSTGISLVGIFKAENFLE